MTNEELVTEYQNSRAEGALSELCLQNTGLVHTIVKRYAAAICRNESAKTAAVIGSDDLMQMGYIGLLQAAEKWDAAGGANFATFAAFWIRQSLIRELDLSGFTIRLPSYKLRQCVQYERFIADYEKEHGTRPTKAEIAAFMGLSVEIVEQIAFDASLRRTTSLDAPMGDSEGESGTLADYIGATDEAFEMVELDADRERLAEVVAGVLQTLPEKQRAVLHGRYWKGQTLRQIGNEIGSSIESVRQCEKRAIKRIRKSEAACQLEPYFYKDYAKALHGTVSSFLRTRTSSTERLALRNYEAKYEPGRRWLKQKERREKWEQEMQELYEACGMEYKTTDTKEIINNG